MLSLFQLSNVSPQGDINVVVLILTLKLSLVTLLICAWSILLDNNILLEVLIVYKHNSFKCYYSKMKQIKMSEFVVSNCMCIWYVLYIEFNSIFKKKDLVQVIKFQLITWSQQGS